MKLSTKSRYGLKAAYILAKSGKEIVPLSTLSKEIGVSGGYIEQLMRLLKADDIVTSERGSNGGYLLAREPSEILVGEVMRSLEDNLEIADCLTKTPCSTNCATRKVWERIYNAINESLDKITLQDMIEGRV